jgi:predicted RNA-binding protein YlqC (UPF0109 family)
MSRRKEIEQTFTDVIRSICLFPEKLKFETTETGTVCLLAVGTVKPDTGRLIGTGGIMFRALRAVLQAMASRYGLKFDLQIPEPYSEEKAFRRKQWDPVIMEELLRDIFRLLCSDPEIEIASGVSGTVVHLKVDLQELDLVEEWRDAIEVVLESISRAHQHQIKLAIN